MSVTHTLETDNKVGDGFNRNKTKELEMNWNTQMYLKMASKHCYSVCIALLIIIENYSFIYVGKLILK